MTGLFRTENGLPILRHSHGSHLLASGMELTAVSERLGHSSPSVTADTYSHAVTGRDREAACKWEEFQKTRGRIENGSTKGRIVRPCVTAFPVGL
jgi:integrase